MVVPKLRFKEFDSSWDNTSFQKLFTFKNGINASKEQYGSGTKFINVLDIINNSTGITYDSIIGSVEISEKDIEKNLVNYGDVLFQRSSETREEVGQSNVYLGKEPIVFGGFVIRGAAQIPYDPIFINALLKTDKVRDQITQLSGGSTRFNIGQDSLNKVSVFLPSQIEQTKIASFLSAVDEKISQLTQKHELLSQYKQGMMQKLFSQQIRFKADDGSEFGEWEEKALNTLCSRNYQGINTVADKVEYQQVGYPILQAKHITSEKLDFADVRYLSDLDYKKYKEKYIPKVNDILFSNIGTIGKVVLVDAESPFFIAWNIFLITPKENLIKPQYLTSYLRWLTSLNYFDNLQAGNATKFINKTDLLATLINLPCLEEQTKIANFLSAIDQKIEVMAQQIEQAKQWKKGLLQQMFV